jgi:hypothetical protein
MTTISIKEDPQTASGYQATVGLMILLSLSSLVGFVLVYLMYLGGNMQWFPGAPFVNMENYKTELLKNAIHGTQGFLTMYAPIFACIIVSFVLVTRLPVILGNEKKREDLYKMLWHGVIPIGTVTFFALLVFRFLGGRFMNMEWVSSGMLMFILVIAGVIFTGIGFKAVLNVPKPSAQ